jgi:anti-anti-sigma regulatory factor
MTVKKKTASKKTASRKTAARKATAPVIADNDSPVMAHDPLSMLEDAMDELAGDFSVQDTGADSAAGQPDEMLVAAAEMVSAEPAQQHEAESAPEPEADTVLATVTYNASGGFDLGTTLTIADAESLKGQFIELLAEGAPITLNAVDVDQCDGAGLQLLSVFYKEASSRDIKVSWSSVSSNFHEAVSLMGLVNALGLENVEVEDDGEGVSWGLF